MGGEMRDKTKKFTMIQVGRITTYSTMQIECPSPLDKKQVREFAQKMLEHLPGWEFIAAR